jgi:catechol-2,3-dioxygenase
MEYELNPRTRIGHVHLTVANLDRALAFYRDLMGFQVTARFGKECGVSFIRKLSSSYRIKYLGW